MSHPQYRRKQRSTLHVPRHHEKARWHVEASVLRMASWATVADTRDKLMRAPPAVLDVVIVTDGADRYLGAVALSALLTAPAEASIGTLVDEAWPSVGMDFDQELAVEIAAEADVTVLPVIGASGQPLGCITARSMLEILAAEHREDVHRMAGILRERLNERHALLDPPIKRFISRMPWLLVGLAISSIGTAVMAGFETTLQANVAVAFFIPALVYLTDAIGTQTEAIAVRGLSVADQPFPRILLNEVVTGALIGATLGILAFVGIIITFGNTRLAFAVCSSLIVAGMIASLIGLLLPWLLSRQGIDPALGSGPVATIVQDVLTLLIYFAIVTTVLRSG